jgi:hypothetical protein
MRKLILLLGMLLLCALPSFAQFTNASAVVKDANGNIYALGKYNVTFVPGPTSAQPLIDGSSFQKSFSGTLDVNGNLAIQLADNVYIGTSSGATGTQWHFSVCAAAGTPCFGVNLTITGGSQNITNSLQSASALLPGTNVLYSIFNNQSGTTPTPAAGKVNLYSKTDRKLYYKDETGAETGPLGTGGGGGGVTSFNTLTGAVTISAGSGISLTPAGNNIAIAATGGGGTPGAPDTSVQTNQGGVFVGDDAFTFNATTKAVGGLGGVYLNPTALATPAAPTVTPTNGAGTTYGYTIVARLGNLATDGPNEGLTAVGPAVLNGTDFNTVTWSAVTGATSYDVYRSTSNGTPATTGLIGNTAALLLVDNGLTADNGTTPYYSSSGKLGVLPGAFFGVSESALNPNSQGQFGNPFVEISSKDFEEGLAIVAQGAMAPGKSLHAITATAILLNGNAPSTIGGQFTAIASEQLGDTVSDITGILARVQHPGAGTLNIAYGVYIDNVPGVGLSNYNLYVHNNIAGTPNDWAIFVDQGKSEFDGQLGLGADPGASIMLDVQGGAAMSATAYSPVGGAGLNDATFQGTPTQFANFFVAIDSTGTPDTFTWAKDFVTQAAGVPITGAAQALSDGVTVTFAATTGHTNGNQWSSQATTGGYTRTKGGLGIGAIPANGVDLDVTTSAPYGGVARVGSLTASKCVGTDANKHLVSDTNCQTLPDLVGTTGSIGGGLLTIGTCTSGTASVTGATTAMSATASPVTYPGDGNYWLAYVSGADVVTVKVCAVATLTPTASNYNVRVLQ